MQYIAAITQCTNRKKSTGSCISKSDIIQPGSLESGVDDWADAIDSAKQTLPVMRLYCGRGFSEFQRAVEDLADVKCYVVSPGLGLVSGTGQAPNYNLTIAPNSDNSILKDANFNALDWWRAINKKRNSTTTPISDLILGSSFDLVLIGVSKPYLAMIGPELEVLTDEQLSKVRLIGPVNGTGISKKITRILMPYNHNLDSEDSPNRGTRSDLGQRAFRHFVETVLNDNPGGTTSQHQDAVARAMASLTTNVLKKDGVKLTDDEVVAKIGEYWDVCSGRSGKTLRHLRMKGFACEQSRFAQIFNEVKKVKLKHGE